MPSNSTSFLQNCLSPIAGAAAFARDLVAIAPLLIARKGQSVDHGLKQGTGRRAKQARPSSNIG